MIRGRPREFSPEQALDRAMEAFWQHGYRAVSITRLQRAMGISRQSLYNTFGGKQQLFVSVLRRYREKRMAAALAPLERPDAGVSDVRAYLDFIVARTVESHPRRAGLVTNTLVEMGSQYPAIAEITAHVLQAAEDAIAHALVRAQKRGELPPDRRPRDLARFVVAVAHGLMVVGKSGMERKDMLRTVDVAMSLLT